MGFDTIEIKLVNPKNTYLMSTRKCLHAGPVSPTHHTLGREILYCKIKRGEYHLLLLTLRNLLVLALYPTQKIVLEK